MKTLETIRLQLRNWQLEDAPQMFEYAKLPSVGPNAGWAPHQSMEESEMIIKRFIEQNDCWAIVLKSENKVIGSIGLHRRTDLSGAFVTELGYVLSTPYEGNGYMTEAAQAVITHAFEELNIPLIKCYHFIGNRKSERVIQKCGFIYDQQMVYKTVATGEKISKSYHLNKKEYEKRRGKNL
jgi:ribosomal-protein-alanine N-acetyltransferase